jgi:hypothetical protein
MPDDYRSRQATLGCGTLILIALIVLFFSRPGIGTLENEVRGLRSDVKELKATIDRQTALIRELKQKVERGRAKE